MQTACEETQGHSISFPLYIRTSSSKISAIIIHAYIIAIKSQNQLTPSHASKKDQKHGHLEEAETHTHRLSKTPPQKQSRPL